MDNETLIILLGSVLGLTIFCWAIYEIVFSSSYGRKVWVESRKQTAVLIEMAIKAGVDTKIIDEILDEDQYKLKS